MAMSFVSLTQAASQAIEIFIKNFGVAKAVRIEIQSSGCCDSSLGLRLDAARDSDLVQESNGIEFIMDRELLGLVGDVNIDYRFGNGQAGFVMTSRKPLNEWQGFGISTIRI
ncbi:MAG: hypothetical protein M0036_09415 [Desulfobacteraceae bacterium]|nr:hypothetical protein [Desulfobacteraceae bacterium]